MSRSRKKVGVLKDKGLRTEDYNRRFRRVNKQRVKENKEPILMNELIDSYDVYDWKFWYDNDRLEILGKDSKRRFFIK